VGEVERGRERESVCVGESLWFDMMDFVKGKLLWLTYRVL
jgi:hypothetical protein